MSHSPNTTHAAIDLYFAKELENAEIQTNEIVYPSGIYPPESFDAFYDKINTHYSAIIVGLNNKTI